MQNRSYTLWVEYSSSSTVLTHRCCSWVTYPHPPKKRILLYKYSPKTPKSWKIFGGGASQSHCVEKNHPPPPICSHTSGGPIHNKTKQRLTPPPPIISACWKRWMNGESMLHAHACMMHAATGTYIRADGGTVQEAEHVVSYAFNSAEKLCANYTATVIRLHYCLPFVVVCAPTSPSWVFPAFFSP